MINAAPSTTFEAVFYGFASGLVGTAGARIEDGQGGVVTARATTGIVESPAGSGVYNVTRVAPAALGDYSVVFDNGAALPTPSDYAVVQLAVNASIASSGGPNYALPSTSTEITFYGFNTALVGTCGYRIEDGLGALTIPRTTQGIVESPAGSGVYTCRIPATPSTPGQYTVVFDNGNGVLTPVDYAVETLTIIGIPGPAYATQDDVLLRAGRVASAFSIAGKRPNLADIAQLVTDTAAEIDQAIRARGFDPVAIDASSKAALRDLNAYGALYRALTGIDDPSETVQKRIDEARSIWEGAMGNRAGTKDGTISRGTFAAIAALEAGRGGGGPVTSAGDFWNEEPTYGTPASVRAEADELWGTNLAPGVAKGQKL